MGDISRWLRAYVDFGRLDRFISAEKGNGGLKESLVLVLLGNSLAFLAIAAAMLAGVLLFPAWSALPLGTVLTSVFVSLIFGYTLVFLLTTGLIFAISRLLDGTGGFAEQVYVLGIFNLCANLLSLPFVMLSVLLGQSQLAVLLQLAIVMLGVYQLYVFYRTVRTLHSLSMLRSLAVLLLAIIALWLLFTAILARVAAS